MVNRIEIISQKSRKYTIYDIDVVEIDFQDKGKTMKIFVNE